MRPRRAQGAPRFLNQIPPEVLEDAALAAAIAALPANYSFEVHKSVWHVRKHGFRRVALQLPEGLQRYALILADVHVRFGGALDAVILGDVTYGACCIDDWTATLLGCDVIIHYGHSCLIPVTRTLVPVLYIFVEIAISSARLLAILTDESNREALGGGRRIALMGTVQFVALLHAIKADLARLADDPAHAGCVPNVYIPQVKPLSPGEVLGCTSPRLPADCAALIFVADGRFHLEAAMIANPSLAAYRFDPFTQVLFREAYDHDAMLATRKAMIQDAARLSSFGLILGTLGRQGSLAVFDSLRERLCPPPASGGEEDEEGRRRRTLLLVLMSEVRPEKLAQIGGIEAWVQTSCPRLSIDWNYTFDAEGRRTPLLTPYEANVMVRAAEPFWEAEGGAPTPGAYPMDFYASADGAHKAGPWTPGYHLRPPRVPQGSDQPA